MKINNFKAQKLEAVRKKLYSDLQVVRRQETFLHKFKRWITALTKGRK